MDKKNNNSGLIVLVIFLLICILALGGYIIYDKILYPNNEKEEFTKQNTTQKNTEEYSLSNYPRQDENNIKIKGDILELAKNNLSVDDYSTIENYLNFEEINFNVKDINIGLSCKTFDSTNNICIKKNINLNNVINLEFEDYVNYEGVYLLITDDYYIVQYGNGVTNYGGVYIYDDKGKELTKTESTTIYTNQSNGEKYVVIEDNKVYFIKHVNCENTFSYIDLKNNFKIVELDVENTMGINEC